MDRTYVNLMRLNRSERSRLLCRLDDKPAPTAPEKRRESRRKYRVEDTPLVVQHPAGGRSHFLVYTRNLSSGGLAFLHGGYLHRGSQCRIVLRRRDGRLLGVDAVVRHCLHVDGLVHEVGVEFIERVPVEDILDPDLIGLAEGEQPQSAVSQLAGRLLYVEDSPLERRLMSHLLRSTSLRMTTVSTTGAALDAVRRGRFDIILCDLHLDEQNAIPLIAELRALGFRGPILLVTADEDTDALARARAAGANDIVGKPYGFEMLASLLSEWLQTPTIDNPVFSAMENDPGMADLIVDFINTARRSVEIISHGLHHADYDAIRAACLNLQGAGAGFGFPSVSVAAAAVVKTLNDMATGEEPSALDTPVRRLAGIVNRLRCSTSARPIQTAA